MIDRSQKVYMAHCIGPEGNRIGAVKIGCSHGWNERIKDVVANLPFTLEIAAVVPGGFFMEAVCHLHLKEERIGGEYFRSSERTLGFVSRCAETGEAFRYISDTGAFECSLDMIKAFLSYHSVSAKEACERAGLAASYYIGKSGLLEKKSREVLAAAALVAASRGQYSTWPGHGLQGQTAKKTTKPRVPKARQSEAAQ